MSTIPVGCRVDQATIEQFDKLASERGTNRAGLLRSAIARELGQETQGDLAQELALLRGRVAQLENVLLAMAGAIAQL